MYTHWVDFVCTILPQIITFSAPSAGQLVRCYADVIAALATVEEEESLLQSLAQPETPRNRDRSGSVSSYRSSFESSAASEAAAIAASGTKRPRGPAGVGARPLVHGLAYVLQTCLLSDPHTSTSYVLVRHRATVEYPGGGLVEVDMQRGVSGV